MNLGQVLCAAVPFGNISQLISPLGQHLDMGVIKPVAVFMKITNLSKWHACLKELPCLWQSFPTKMTVKTVKGFIS